MRSLFRGLVERILSWSARRVLAATNPTIIGVTGSSGKTSTKDAITHVLTATLTRPVQGAFGNLNSEFGLPLAILNIPKPDGIMAWLKVVVRAMQIGFSPPLGRNGVLVLEYGAEFPGDIAKLVAIAQPTVAVVTNIGPAHLEFFKTLDNVAKDKVTLILKVPATGRVILSAQDQFADWMAKQTRAEVIRLQGEGGDFAKAAALSVADWFDVDPARAVAALAAWSPPPGRLVAMPGINHTTLLDDTYNANPSSTTLALNTARNLAKKHGAKRLVAVLGDMLELGDEEARYHRGIALLAQKAADITVLVGRRYQGMPTDQWFLSPQEAIAFLKHIATAGDIILVKGSQGMRMEKVVEALLADPVDSKKLVRQSPAWRSKPFVQP